jgi:NADPH:quinone reductase
MQTNIPETMQAVKLERPDGPLTIGTVKVPQPLDGEVLVKMACAPVNPSDLLRIKSISGEYIDSFIPGIEGSGTIVSAGKGLLPKLWLGKRVACSSLNPASGTWAEYMATSASFCFPIPKAISDEQGSMLLVNPMTAVAFFDIIKKEKHKAIVNSAAAGALGQMIIILGKKHNISVINVVRNEKQADLLQKKGARYVLKNTDKDFVDQLRLMAHDLNATLALDPITGTYTQQLLDNLPYGSTVIVYGNLAAADQGTTLRPLLLENKKLHGFYLANWMKDNNLLKTITNLNKVKRLLRNDFNVTVQGRFPLDKAQLAIDTYLNNMTAGKVLLIPGFKQI